MKAQSGFNHIADPYVNGLQICTRCEGVICDDRGASYAVEFIPGEDRTPPIEASRQPFRLPRGFPEGPVFISGNCTGAGHYDEYDDCHPKS